VSPVTGKNTFNSAFPALFLVLALLCAGCSSSGSVTAGNGAPGRNPFGVALGGEGLPVQQRIDLARELGVPFFRPWVVTVAGWNGQSEEIDAIQAAGFKLLLTVRNGGAVGPPAVPSSPPADLNAYRKTLSGILDKYPAELLLVEDQEDSPDRWSGTPEQYGAELQAAGDVAHARGVKCANGGLSSSLVVAMTWDRYREQGREAEAEDFMRRAATPEQREMLATDQGRARLEYSINQGKRFLAQYARAGIDFVNFHWYVPDAAALGEAVAFLKEATGLQPVTGEMGQYDTSPEAVSSLLPAVLELGLPYAAWFSVDHGQARALQNPDGTWRDNGRAFLTFMQDTY
jgi:hypothetical protein